MYFKSYKIRLNPFLVVNKKGMKASQQQTIIEHFNRFIIPKNQFYIQLLQKTQYKEFEIMVQWLDELYEITRKTFESST